MIIVVASSKLIAFGARATIKKHKVKKPSGVVRKRFKYPFVYTYDAVLAPAAAGVTMSSD